MAAVTVTGTVNGVSVFLTTNAALQTALAQQVLAAAAAVPGAQLVTGGAAALTSTVAVDIGAGGVLTGSAAIPVAQVALGVNGSQFQTYITGATAVSTVVASDNANATIVNSSPTDALVAQTGAGNNLLYGAAGQNNFFTGNGGANDVVILNGSINNLDSRGNDAVLVGGPSTVTASAGGTDNVLMTAGTTLAFINGSRAPQVDSITGASGSAIVLAGTGSTSITSGAGPETFFIDTSAGSTTLNAAGTPNDAITFIKDAATSTATIVVNNFGPNDLVQVRGYAGFNVQAAPTGGATLLLSDGAQVTFSNVSVATLQQTVKDRLNISDRLRMRSGEPEAPLTAPERAFASTGAERPCRL